MKDKRSRAEQPMPDLGRDFAKNMMIGAPGALDQAHTKTATQHRCIAPYVRPSLPHSPLDPQALFGILKTIALAFAIRLIGFLVERSIRERSTWSNVRLYWSRSIVVARSSSRLAP